jgi:hypothetical protein
MKHLSILTLSSLLFLTAGSAGASEYADFLRDMASPYGQYRQSLVLTSSKDHADKAQQAITSFTQGWEAVATKYAGDAPRPFAGISDFSAKIQRPVAVGKEALALMKEGKVARAHAALEEVRYLLWDMRVRSGINSIADKSNDFHEAMEVVLDHAAAAKSADELMEVGERYAAWLSIKWEDHALAGDLAAIRKDFDPAFADGRKAVGDYLGALRKGDLEAAKKLSGGVKNAYKKLWALDPK